MTHYKNSLLNKSGEGHIDTGIKIIIGIVVGALILGGLYALFDNLVMPKLNAKVQDMMHYEEGASEFSLDGKRVDYSLYQNPTGTFGMVVKVYDAPTGTSAIGHLYKSTDGRSWQRDGLPIVFF